MNFYMPVKLYTGRNCLSDHRDELAKLGKNCLIITGGSSAKKCGALADLETVLQELGIKHTLFDRVSSNPAVSACCDAGKLAAASGCDFLIGVGGGSALDAAKAASVFATNLEMTEAEFYSGKWKNRPLPVALIGTTAGTGSEVTKVAVLTDSKKLKHSIHDDLLYASVSFGDPLYTMSMPSRITLSTGVDVLAHCAESYFSKKANEFSRMFSLQGISMLLAPLSSAADGTELTYTQREQLYNASIMGGMAINITGTCFPHNIGYYLTENCGVPHGFASAFFFPDLMEHVKKSVPEVTEAFYRGLGVSETELSSFFDHVMPELQIEINREHLFSVLPKWENNGSVKNTLGTVTVDDIARYFKKFT